MTVDDWEYLELKKSEIIGEAFKGNIFAGEVKKWFRKYKECQDQYTGFCLSNALHEYRDSMDW